MDATDRGSRCGNPHHRVDVSIKTHRLKVADEGATGAKRRWLAVLAQPPRIEMPMPLYPPNAGTAWKPEAMAAIGMANSEMTVRPFAC